MDDTEFDKEKWVKEKRSNPFAWIGMEAANELCRRENRPLLFSDELIEQVRLEANPSETKTTVNEEAKTGTTEGHMYHSCDRPPVPRYPNLSTTMRRRVVADARNDTRIDALESRFPWLSQDSHQWSMTSTSLNTPVHTPRQYHLRRRPQIHCPACIQGDLGQLSHMQGPYGCLFVDEKDNETTV